MKKIDNINAYLGTFSKEQIDKIKREAEKLQFELSPADKESMLKDLTDALGGREIILRTPLTLEKIAELQIQYLRESGHWEHLFVDDKLIYKIYQLPEYAQKEVDAFTVGLLYHTDGKL